MEQILEARQSQEVSPSSSHDHGTGLQCSGGCRAEGLPPKPRALERKSTLAKKPVAPIRTPNSHAGLLSCTSYL